MAIRILAEARSPRTELEEALHGVTQPLTSLQCRLEIGLLLGDAVSARQALQDSLLELRRVLAAISRMRAALEGSASGKSQV